MKEKEYKELAEKIIKVIKDFEFRKVDKITLETKITNVVDDDRIIYNIFIGDIEEYCEIEIPDDEMFHKIYYNGTVKNLIDYIAKSGCLKMEVNEDEFINCRDEDEYEKITEEEVDKIIEDIERKIEEAKSNEIALNKIRWSEKDKESYKNPL